MTPPAAPTETILPDASWRTSPSTPARAGKNASVVGFSSRATLPDPFSQRVTAIVQRTPQVRTLSPVRVDMNGEVATLRGRVATQQDRELAENLIRLEPGVSDVRNELSVGGTR